jgi:colicin import membrane protein
MKLVRAFGTLMLLSLTAVACDDSEELAAKAKTEAAAKAAAAEKAADDLKAEAARQVRIADAKAAPARAEARAAIQKTVSAGDRTAMDLKERLAKLKGKAKANAEAASAEYDKRRTAAERDLEGLNQASGTAWETLKAQTDKDVEALKAALDAFQKALGR